METPPPAARWLPAKCFEGQVAVVTGGGTGLGLEISRGLAALGARVVIGSRTAEHHATLLDEARQLTRIFVSAYRTSKEGKRSEK